jgi:hypothetical protein
MLFSRQVLRQGSLARWFHKVDLLALPLLIGVSVPFGITRSETSVPEINLTAPRSVYSVVTGRGTRGLRRIEVGEADPQNEDRLSSTVGAPVVPLPNAAPGFTGVSATDSVRLSQFVQHDFAAASRIVTALCGSGIDPDGAVAEAVARSVERLGSGKSIDSLTAWVTRVAVNIGRSENRK